jgi:septal ring factor EnvC (AmiA/AmiB activator)
MADIFEVMRQRIKAMEKEIDTSKEALNKATRRVDELEEQVASYKEALKETDSMLEAVSTQLRSWGRRPVVNVTWRRERNEELLT